MLPDHETFTKRMVFIITLMWLNPAIGLHATPVVDQQFTTATVGSSVGSGLWRQGDDGKAPLAAQTFKVGSGGMLVGADVLVVRGAAGGGNPIGGDVTYSLMATFDGLPSGTVLASGILSAAELPMDTLQVAPFSHIAFPSGIAVAPGQMLALALGGLNDYWRGQMGGAATYADGRALVILGGQWVGIDKVDPGGRVGDFNFRTYVEVPEPSQLVLFCIGCGAFSIQLMRLRKQSAGSS